MILITAGEFDGDGDNTDVAVGMPRGAGLNGKVLVYNKNLTNTYNLTGDQVTYVLTQITVELFQTYVQFKTTG